MEYELKLEQFSGPIHKLLELIESKKMEVTQISLAEVTEDFLKYVRSLEKIEVPMLADFIVVASRLVLIKSKSLLPDLELSEEDEEGIKDLEYRLRIYKELKPFTKNIGELLKKQNWQFSRPYFMEISGGASLNVGQEAAIFYPGEKMSLEVMVKALSGIISSFEVLKMDEETIREKVVSIEEKIQEIISRFQMATEGSLRDFSKEKSRAEIIVIFLALLHLARDGMVRLEQENYFSDIMITKS